MPEPGTSAGKRKRVFAENRLNFKEIFLVLKLFKGFAANNT